MIECEVLYEQLDGAQRGYDTGFVIDSDEKADWALRKISEDQQEFERIKAIAESQIMELQMRIAQEQAKVESKTSFLKGCLRSYFETVPHKSTKTQESYRLLSGSLVKKVATQKIVRPDDEDLIKYLRDSGQDCMIRVEEKPAWADLKKNLQIIDGNVVDMSTGAIMDILKVEEVPEAFDIKF